MAERRLTFHVTNTKPQPDGRYGKDLLLDEFLVRGAAVDPTTVQVGATFQKVVPLEGTYNTERWGFEGPYRTWTPGTTLSFEGTTVRTTTVRITVKALPKDLNWDIPVSK